MARNVEIKAHLNDPERVRSILEGLSDPPVEILEQTDTFFNVARGRLKLRVQRGRSELIYYERPDSASARESRYFVVSIDEPDLLCKVLSQAIGIRGTVNKRRYLYRDGKTRIHLDEVERLGWFLELEVVLAEGESVADGVAVAERLMGELGIEGEDLVGLAYIDLLEGERR